MEEIVLTQKEFDDLSEYSCSLPTGTIIGKRWKRNNNAFAKEMIGLDFWDGIPIYKNLPPDWMMGEYVPDPKAEIVNGKPKTILILWKRIKCKNEEY